VSFLKSFTVVTEPVHCLNLNSPPAGSWVLVTRNPDFRIPCKKPSRTSRGSPTYLTLKPDEGASNTTLRAEPEHVPCTESRRRARGDGRTYIGGECVLPCSDMHVNFYPASARHKFPLSFQLSKLRYD